MSVDIEKFKSHIHFEEGMDDSLLEFYLLQATNYVKNGTGEENEQLILLVASVFYQFRVSEKDLESALNALTPFFVSEVYNAESDDE
ncbi:phage gp6-like head-tail connector protein [Listeria monocytogenes]|uniref:head-tail connector protein n=1 Tax=Listeria cossartiae TaxID=2838249 RepID=UPI00128A9E3A|nr:head-tail connector protein [Listeria cossartiae]ECC0873466.1 phage gp6-like head-tail connector protein [Listeria monocytogenes]ECC0879641.1 phage gp6-like head-tail connector protein [Listeria monocytogenes]ECC0891859.1 phage gp6-like head-tail connector protein [Listeria monocytogenes]ECC0894961.1 phage gp6-like head-tail connector protein [Listeria monocytogenes]EEO6560702.1 phage gp6-like head-tail connector protein [Listeria monocytogenes]